MLPDTFTADDLRTMGEDLLLELTPLAGDDAAIGATLARWHHTLGGPHLAMVCSAALREAFTQCVVVVYRSPEEIPA